MNKYINKKVANISEYVPAEDIYKIRLDANESFIAIPDEILLKIKEAVQKVSFNRYPDPACNELRKAFGDFIGVDFNNVVAGNGSDELISILISAFMQKGDKVLTFAPDFSMYNFYCNTAEIECITINKDSDFNIDLEKTKDIVNSDKSIRLVIFSNPCNPTGVGVKREIIEDFISNVDCLVALDEAYMDFWDESESLIPFIGKYGNLIVLKTLSKACGLAAVRVGFAVSNSDIINSLLKLKSPFNVNSVSQSIATTILMEKEYLKQSRLSCKNSVEYLKKRLSEFKSLDILESKTNFLLIKTDKASAIYEYLKKNDIIIRFISENLIRITAGSAQEIDILCEKLQSWGLK